MRVEMPLPLRGGKADTFSPEPENLPLLICPCLRGRLTSGSGLRDLTKLPVGNASPPQTLARKLPLGATPRDSELKRRP